MNNGQNTLFIAGSIIAAGIVIALGIALAGSGSGGAISPDGGGTANFDILPVTESDHIQGDTDAQVVMVEYSDVGCVHCQNLHGVLNRVIDDYEANEFAWVFRHFPIRAPREAHATECVANLAGEDAFWSYTNLLMEQAQRRAPDGDIERLADAAEGLGVDREAFISCQEDGVYEDTVNAHLQDARQAGAQGTPFNVFVVRDGISEEQISGVSSIINANAVVSEDQSMLVIPGGLPYDMLKSVIDVLRGN